MGMDDLEYTYSAYLGEGFSLYAARVRSFGFNKLFAGRSLSCAKASGIIILKLNLFKATFTILFSFVAQQDD